MWGPLVLLAFQVGQRRVAAGGFHLCFPEATAGVQLQSAVSTAPRQDHRLAAR